MPTIIGELKGFNIYAWVFTAYMMTSAVTVPIYGKLSDIYGRKPFYVLSLAVFMIGSALPAQAMQAMQNLPASVRSLLSDPQALITSQAQEGLKAKFS
jgi:MFS family permease